MGKMVWSHADGFSAGLRYPAIVERVDHRQPASRQYPFAFRQVRCGSYRMAGRWLAHLVSEYLKFPGCLSRALLESVWPHPAMGHVRLSCDLYGTLKARRAVINEHALGWDLVGLSEWWPPQQGGSFRASMEGARLLAP